MSFTGTLARWSIDGTADRLAEAARERVGTAMLDWFGAFYAGLASPEAALYRDAASVLDADPDLVQSAWLTAAISHIEEVDDGHRLAMLHPGVVAIPPVLALASRDGAPIGRVRTAIAVGYEVSVRVGAALGPSHYKTHHSSATAGCFGAAAAAGIMLGLDQERMTWALGHAGTQAAGLWQIIDDGAETAKPAHIGHAVRNGLTAAAMAKAGILGARHILEGSRGFAKGFGLDLDADKLLPATEANGLALTTSTTKAWPVCGQMHHILDAVQTLRTRHAVPASEIAEVRIVSFAATSEIAGIIKPRTIAQARFSTAFCVALLWIKGALILNEAALTDPEVVQLAGKVTLHADAAFTDGFPQRRAGRVTLVTRSGERYEHLQEGRRGDPEFPLSDHEMAERFDALAARQSPGRRADVRQLARALAEGSSEDRIAPRTIEALLSFKQVSP